MLLLHGGERLACAAHQTRNTIQVVRVRRDCSAHFAPRRLSASASAEWYLLTRSRALSATATRSSHSHYRSVSLRDTPTASRADCDKRRPHWCPRLLCSAEPCCSSLTGTAPPACTPSFRSARLTTRSLSGECSSTVGAMLPWTPELSRATDSFYY